MGVELRGGWVIKCARKHRDEELLWISAAACCSLEEPLSHNKRDVRGDILILSSDTRYLLWTFDLIVEFSVGFVPALDKVWEV